VALISSILIIICSLPDGSSNPEGDIGSVQVCSLSSKLTDGWWLYAYKCLYMPEMHMNGYKENSTQTMLKINFPDR
jgi:hypothetical protein